MSALLQSLDRIEMDNEGYKRNVVRVQQPLTRAPVPVFGRDLSTARAQYDGAGPFSTVITMQP